MLGSDTRPPAPLHQCIGSRTGKTLKPRFSAAALSSWHCQGHHHHHHHHHHNALMAIAIIITKVVDTVKVIKYIIVLTKDMHWYQLLKKAMETTLAQLRPHG